VGHAARFVITCLQEVLTQDRFVHAWPYNLCFFRFVNQYYDHYAPNHRHVQGMHMFHDPHQDMDPHLQVDAHPWSYWKQRDVRLLDELTDRCERRAQQLACGDSDWDGYRTDYRKEYFAIMRDSREITGGSVFLKQTQGENGVPLVTKTVETAGFVNGMISRKQLALENSVSAADLSPNKENYTALLTHLAWLGERRMLGSACMTAAVWATFFTGPDAMNAGFDPQRTATKSKSGAFYTAVGKMATHQSMSPLLPNLTILQENRLVDFYQRMAFDVCVARVPVSLSANGRAFRDPLDCMRTAQRNVSCVRISKFPIDFDFTDTSWGMTTPPPEEMGRLQCQLRDCDVSASDAAAKIDDLNHQMYGNWESLAETVQGILSRDVFGGCTVPSPPVFPTVDSLVAEGCADAGVLGETLLALEQSDHQTLTAILPKLDTCPKLVAWAPYIRARRKKLVTDLLLRVMVSCSPRLVTNDEDIFKYSGHFVLPLPGNAAHLALYAEVVTEGLKNSPRYRWAKERIVPDGSVYSGRARMRDNFTYKTVDGCPRCKHTRTVGPSLKNNHWGCVCTNGCMATFKKGKHERYAENVDPRTKGAGATAAGARAHKLCFALSADGTIDESHVSVVNPQGHTQVQSCLRELLDTSVTTFPSSVCVLKPKDQTEEVFEARLNGNCDSYGRPLVDSPYTPGLLDEFLSDEFVHQLRARHGKSRRASTAKTGEIMQKFNTQDPTAVSDFLRWITRQYSDIRQLGVKGWSQDVSLQLPDDTFCFRHMEIDRIVNRTRLGTGERLFNVYFRTSNPCPCFNIENPRTRCCGGLHSSSAWHKTHLEFANYDHRLTKAKRKSTGGASGTPNPGSWRIYPACSKDTVGESKLFRERLASGALSEALTCKAWSQKPCKVVWRCEDLPKAIDRRVFKTETVDAEKIDIDSVVGMVRMSQASGRATQTGDEELRQKRQRCEASPGAGTARASASLNVGTDFDAVREQALGVIEGAHPLRASGMLNWAQQVLEQFGIPFDDETTSETLSASIDEVLCHYDLDRRDGHSVATTLLEAESVVHPPRAAGLLGVLDAEADLHFAQGRCLEAHASYIRNASGHGQ